MYVDRYSIASTHSCGEVCACCDGGIMCVFVITNSVPIEVLFYYFFFLTFSRDELKKYRFVVTERIIQNHLAARNRPKTLRRCVDDFEVERRVFFLPLYYLWTRVVISRNRPRNTFKKIIYLYNKSPGRNDTSWTTEINLKIKFIYLKKKNKKLLSKEMCTTSEKSENNSQRRYGYDDENLLRFREFFFFCYRRAAPDGHGVSLQIGFDHDVAWFWEKMVARKYNLTNFTVNTSATTNTSSIFSFEGECKHLKSGTKFFFYIPINVWAY